MKLLDRLVVWLCGLFGVFPDPLPTPPAPAKPETDHYAVEPLTKGDVLRTDDGALYSVLGVDEEGVAWCRPMTRLVGVQFQPRVEVMQCRAAEGAHYRMHGVKHSFGEVPS